MTDDLRSTVPNNSACAAFDGRLMAFLEHELEADARAAMEQHRASCERCAAVLRDLVALTAQASTLPSIAPSRDLWSGINARLETPVVRLRPVTAAEREAAPAAGTTNGASSAVMASPRRTPRMISLGSFAVAATVLIAVTSITTWRIARSDGGAEARVATGAPASGGGPAVVPSVEGRSVDNPSPDAPTVLVANAGIVYEQEIAALRTIVDERFTELDSTTVAVLRRNLEIIDRAILDSRMALERDPASRVLSITLDRALESKLALMRRVALL